MDQDGMPAACDLMLDGGTVITLDDAGTVVQDGAVAMTGNKIVAVGARSALRPRFSPASVIATDGCIVLPGLINAHNHAPLMVVRGRMQEYASAPAYTPSVPQGHMLTEEDSYALSRLAAYEMLRAGCTTVADWYWHPRGIARAYHEMGLRAFVSGRITDVDIAALSVGTWRFDHREGDATIRQTEDLFDEWHGADGGRINCVVGILGIDTSSRAQLAQCKALADRRRAPIHMHLNYSASLVDLAARREGCSPVQLIEDLGILDGSLVASHCVSMTDDDRTRIGRARAFVVHAPFGNAEQGCMGNMLALEDAGARIAIGTDAAPVDMLESMRTAAIVARLQGAGARMGARKLLAWTIANGAAALGLDGQLGRIAEGHLADIVVIDGNAPGLGGSDDVVSALVWGAQGANVLHTIVDGKMVLRDGRPIAFDSQEVLEAARSATRRLWAAAQGAAPPS